MLRTEMSMNEKVVVHEGSWGLTNYNLPQTWHVYKLVWGLSGCRIRLKRQLKATPVHFCAKVAA